MRRRLFFTLWMVLGGYVAIELFSFGALRLTQHEWFSYSDFRQQRRDLAGLTEETVDPRAASPLELNYTAHPYLGFVRNPAKSKIEHHWWIGSPEDPFTADPKALFVVILGGSVANNQGRSWATIEDGLREFEPYRDRKIFYVNLASAGYKQPQHLIALTYYLALGGRVDVLISLDGFNEVTSEINRNIKAGVYPHYPSYWSDITQSWTQPGELAPVYESNRFRMRRKQLARGFESLWFSVTGNLVWKLLDTQIERDIYTLNVDVTNRQGLERPIHSQGPQFEGGKDGVAARYESVALWARASVLLSELAREHGFAYFHFLQPNQYVPGSKLHFSSVEQSSRIQREFYRNLVPRWYPELQKAGAALREDDVSFFDLTAIFRDVGDTIYRDDCCHLTPLGRDLLAREITGHIVEELRALPGNH